MTIINNSNDNNNAQIVIFQSGVAESELMATATHVVIIPHTQTLHVPLPAETRTSVAIPAPGVIKGQQIHTVTLLTPLIAVQAGQTVYITGNAETGYFVTVRTE